MDGNGRRFLAQRSRGVLRWPDPRELRAEDPRICCSTALVFSYLELINPSTLVGPIFLEVRKVKCALVKGQLRVKGHLSKAKDLRPPPTPPPTTTSGHRQPPPATTSGHHRPPPQPPPATTSSHLWPPPAATADQHLRPPPATTSGHHLRPPPTTSGHRQPPTSSPPATTFILHCNHFTSNQTKKIPYAILFVKDPST
ncbi:hypothetical protein M5K25_008464 [Dendrobium thyrsiflorum]|uniref:Uncharacterized protein n=1 Tax=Dendrobium thyrsiflorum TaxID=117978 RepID=A0ABD0V9X9_DENTH